MSGTIELMKQAELDAFEKAVLMGLFNQPTIPEWADLALSLQGIDAQAYVNKFESIMKPFLKDNGLVNAETIRKLVNMKYPKYVALVPDQDFRLVDVVQKVAAALADLNLFK